MARFFLYAGSIGLVRDAQESTRVPTGATLLADAQGATDFDPSTNTALVADFDTGYARFSTSAGVLRRDGVNVTFAAESDQTAMQKGAFIGGRRVSQDRSTTSGSYVDVPDLQFPLEPNSHYAFQFDGAYTTQGTTTGIQLAINGPASPAFLAVGFEIGTSVTAYLAAFSGAYDNGVNGTTGGGTTALPFHVYGTISTGAAGGTLALRGRSETNGNTVTIKRGSYGLLFKVG